VRVGRAAEVGVTEVADPAMALGDEVLREHSGTLFVVG